MFLTVIKNFHVIKKYFSKVRRVGKVTDKTLTMNVQGFYMKY